MKFVKEKSMLIVHFNRQNSNNHEEISDEEPVAKIAKLGNEGNKMINNEAQPIVRKLIKI